MFIFKAIYNYLEALKILVIFNCNTSEIKFLKLWFKITAEQYTKNLIYWTSPAQAPEKATKVKVLGACHRQQNKGDPYATSQTTKIQSRPTLKLIQAQILNEANEPIRTKK